LGTGRNDRVRVWVKVIGTNRLRTGKEHRRKRMVEPRGFEPMTS